MNSIQKKTFSTGGFVLHRLQGGFSGRASAWFDEKGNMVEAEQIDRLNRARFVKRNSPIWENLQSWGRIYFSREDSI